MILDGKHEFRISREKLWSYLMDPEVLAKITPGVSKLEVTGPDSFNTISAIKIGPVKGSFKGKLTVADKLEPESFVIKMEQLSKIGNAHASISMAIKEMENGNSELSFNGDAKLSGMIARTGQRVLTGVANAVTKEVFASLEKHIEEHKDDEDDEGDAAIAMDDGQTSPEKATADSEKSTQEDDHSPDNEGDSDSDTGIFSSIKKSIFGDK